MTPGAERPRAVAQAHPVGDRRVAGAAGDGPRRPLPDPPLGHATPIEETMEALHDVVRAGKARYIGASSMYAWQFAQGAARRETHGWTKFVSMQNHHNLVYREEEREMLPLCLDQGIGVIPWSPLARGVLAGNRGARGRQAHDRARRPTRSTSSSTTRRRDFDVVDGSSRSPASGGPPAQVALAWLLHKPGVTAPIVGATKLGHLEDALAARRSSCRPRRSRASRSPTCRMPCRGSSERARLHRPALGPRPPDPRERRPRPRGGGHAAAPGARLRDAAAAVAELQPWIDRRVAEVDAARAEAASRGDAIPYLGGTLRLVPEPARRRAHRTGDVLRVPEDDPPAIERWLRRAARDEITPRAHRAAAALGVEVARVTIRDPRTRWVPARRAGRCRSPGVSCSRPRTSSTTSSGTRSATCGR